MRHEDITRRLDAAADAFRREAAELVGFADSDETQNDAAGETDSFGQHPADAASDTVEREVDLGLRRDADAVLTEIASAKHRLAEGRYGRCETCGRPIDEARLRALPWARRCITDELAFERSSSAMAPSAEQRVRPVDDAPSSEDSAWDPEDDHPVASAEEAAVNADT